MGDCIIFCAGELCATVEKISTEDYILAADGGLRHVNSLGLTPDGCIGDFDSLGFVPEGAQVFPVEKDDTDAMLAVRQGLDLGYRRFLIYGGLDGPRLDHTVANFQTLKFLAERGAQGYLLGKDQVVTAVQNGGLCFPGCPDGTVSVFCMGEDAAGVTLEGLKYPLENGKLTSGFPLGASNRFLGKQAKICVEKGCLLLIYDRKNGFPITIK